MARLLSDNKIKEAESRIRRAIEKVGMNRICVAFSGGKDSEAIRRMVKSVYPEVVVVHNGHRGESVGNTPGVLFVKEPKKQTVPQFLASVQIEAQFDGSRKAEDKMVHIDGVEIHRSQMSTDWTDNGVWGLKVCFPIWDWSDEEVFEYLEMTGPLTFNDIHFSFEGEGPRLGMKTLFCRYNGKAGPLSAENVEIQALGNAAAIYITAETVDHRLMDWVKDLSQPVTIECPLIFYPFALDYSGISSLQWFLTAQGWHSFPQTYRGFVKIKVEEAPEFERLKNDANAFARCGHQVLLMPEFKTSSVSTMGEAMMGMFKDLYPGVRLMPPVQNLLEIR